MDSSLHQKRIAILVADGFEQSEYERPKAALDEAGAETVTVSLEEGEVKGWKHAEWGDSFPVDMTVVRALSEDFDALLLPGGVMNPDKLRGSDAAIEFVRSFGTSGKPIAAICHGPWTLIDAGIAKGRTVTSYKSIKNDLKNAGATWVDQSVVVDRGIVTSRTPDDIPDFNRKMIEEFAEGVHERRVGRA